MSIMTFHSILFQRPEDAQKLEQAKQPVFFVDLNLDQIVESITVGMQEYDLKPFFYVPLTNTDAILYRHEVMRDLENPALFEKVRAFERSMREMREYLAQADKLYYKYQKERWFLDAIELYCQAVRDLSEELSPINLSSRGFISFRDYLIDYVQSTRFTTLADQTQELLTDLSNIRYEILIKGNRVKVRNYEGESDYTAEVEAAFEKFKQGEVKDYRVKFNNYADMNHVEEQVLEGVAHLYPEIFTRLDNYRETNSNYLDDTLRRFDREIQFYIAYLEHIVFIRKLGLSFCYPQITNPSKEISAREAFDLALADHLINKHQPIVCNDFYLTDDERIIVVSGPNQGGKTTFARTYGQLHYLAALGCPVPGREACLWLFDRLFTHFEKEENIQNLRGKLEDDLTRINDILDQATPSSIIIMNEIFTSTTLEDAIFLSKKILERIIELDLLSVCVTFIDELACLEKTVSMVSTIVPGDPTKRTFKIVRKPADGLAYALSIAEKYQLTYNQLKDRLSP
jgi:DNA mismatch repair ATPase MutS